MSSKKGKGGKNKRKGKKQVQDAKRELEFKDESQEYAQVTKMLGNGRLEALCLTENRSIIAHIRGTFRKRVWINMGDVILLGMRDFQDGKADVILKYTPDEARMLKAYGEIPQSVVIGGNGVQQDEDNEGQEYIAFSDNDDDASGSDGEAHRVAASTRSIDDDDDDAAEKDWTKELNKL